MIVRVHWVVLWLSLTSHFHWVSGSLTLPDALAAIAAGVDAHPPKNSRGFRRMHNLWLFDASLVAFREYARAFFGSSYGGLHAVSIEGLDAKRANVVALFLPGARPPAHLPPSPTTPARARSAAHPPVILLRCLAGWPLRVLHVSSAGCGPLAFGDEGATVPHHHALASATCSRHAIFGSAPI